jgi:hypothetical protein
MRHAHAASCIIAYCLLHHSLRAAGCGLQGPLGLGQATGSASVFGFRVAVAGPVRLRLALRPLTGPAAALRPPYAARSRPAARTSLAWPIALVPALELFGKNLHRRDRLTALISLLHAPDTLRVQVQSSRPFFY